MSTHYSFHNQRHHKHIKWAKHFVAVCGLLMVLMGIWLVSSMVARIFEDTQPVSSIERSSAQQPTTEVFLTPYFQFQTGNEWTQDAASSNENVYVYRAYNGTLIQQDITIYVNPTIAPPEVTRVQPVTIDPAGVLKSYTTISQHCSAATPKGTKEILHVVHESVSFMCRSDGTIFEVLVGKRNGTGVLTLNRPKGGTTSFIIVYRDLTAKPVGRDLAEIINTFQSR